MLMLVYNLSNTSRRPTHLLIVRDLLLAHSLQGAIVHGTSVYWPISKSILCVCRGQQATTFFCQHRNQTQATCRDGIWTCFTLHHISTNNPKSIQIFILPMNNTPVELFVKSISWQWNYRCLEMWFEGPQLSNLMALPHQQNAVSADYFIQI